MKKQNIGLIGLGVMGQNLTLNMEDKGYSVAVYNRTSTKTEDFAKGAANGKNILPTYSLEEIFIIDPPSSFFIMSFPKTWEGSIVFM
ncbi:unnamed protein product [marine sediment metagenome]|uniref:6-phosphogluconate dehydrogenase NADP-binding domain-containing protein n=1 Tax=marine sediment metagenome TaxID=412755 RepID=X1B4G6_9ZZZZ